MYLELIMYCDHNQVDNLLVNRSSFEYSGSFMLQVLVEIYFV